MAFELKNAPIEPLAEGDLRVVVKPGPDPQNPAEGGQMAFTKEPKEVTTDYNQSLRKDISCLYSFTPSLDGVNPVKGGFDVNQAYKDQWLKFENGFWLLKGNDSTTGSSIKMNSPTIRNDTAYLIAAKNGFPRFTLVVILHVDNAKFGTENRLVRINDTYSPYIEVKSSFQGQTIQVGINYGSNVSVFSRTIATPGIFNDGVNVVHANVSVVDGTQTEFEVFINGVSIHQDTVTSSNTTIPYSSKAFTGIDKADHAMAVISGSFFAKYMTVSEVDQHCNALLSQITEIYGE